MSGARTGGDLALETLAALGAKAVIGLPGQHALGLFDALRRSGLAYLGARVENNAGFMADGFARASGEVAPLLLSTGPGALTSLPALQEAAAASVPVLAISAQIPVAGLGGGRHGFLHELPEQAAAFRGIVKGAWTVRRTAQIPSALAEAWRLAASAPQGPVLVEIPQDLLLAAAGADAPPVRGPIRTEPLRPQPLPELLDAAAEALAGARRPAILAGGGVSRAGAGEELARLAEALDAPVATTFGGKESFPWDHPLSARSWLEDIATTEFLEDADVLLVVGSGLGELSSNYRTFAPRGRFIQIEADLGKLCSNYPGLGVHADAKPALAGLVQRLAGLPQAPGREPSAPRIRALLETVERRLDGQELAAERRFLRELREAVPDAAGTSWDMTISAYWAWSAWDPRQGLFQSGQGAGGLGTGLPGAIGQAFAHRVAGRDRPVLAVSGDGGAMYGIAELAVIAQERLPVVWLVVDDGGYGILREYMTGAFGEATATELARPDFVALAGSFGLPAERAELAEAPAAVARAFRAGGPRVIVVPALLRMFEATHLDREPVL